MKNNKGLTLIEVLLSLFIFAITILIFNRYCFIINRLTTKNMIKQEIGTIAKNKMEEIKSGYIYIDNNRYCLSDLSETISFEERNYNINVSINPLYDYEDISCINLEVSNEKGNISYNLVRYIDLCKIGLGQQNGE